MKQYASGIVNDHIMVAGNAFYPGYLVRGSKRTLMIDAGINLFGPLYRASLREYLGDHALLDLLFITHSHYDHLGSVPYLKRQIPGLATGASGLVEELLRKESVIERMNRLSEIQRPLFENIVGSEEVRLEPFALDHVLRDGDTFDLGGVTCVAYEVPGHTRDSMAYFIPEYGALFPGEAPGVPLGKEGNGVQVEFLATYDGYVASLEKMVGLKPRLIGMAHGWIFTGDDARAFLDESLAATPVYRALIERSLDETGGDVDAAIQLMARREYDEKGTIYQERNAYIMNLSAQVRLIAQLHQ